MFLVNSGNVFKNQSMQLTANNVAYRFIENPF